MRETLKLIDLDKVNILENDLGMSVYGIPRRIFAFLQDLQKELPDYEISLERNTFEELPLSDILGLQIPVKNTLSKPISIKENPIVKYRKKKKRRHNPDVVIEPSKFEPLTHWEHSKNPKDWRYVDVLGFYLSKYRECVGFEDPEFVGSTWTKSGKLKGQLNDFMKAAKTIEGFSNFLKSLGKDVGDVRDYLEWVFDKFVPNNKWYKFPPVFWKVFELKGFLWKEYIKTKQSKEKKGTAHRWNPHGEIK